MVLRLLLLLLLLAVVIRGIQRLLAHSPAPAPRPTAGHERSPYEVLGVSREATREEIHAAYQKLVRENHPDRVASMSREIRDLAERRTKEINHAYDSLTRG